jgi:hypothetical protein
VGSEKSSVRDIVPRPGRISGVGGFWVDKAPSVEVAEAGNQIMVAVGCAVSVKMIGVGVAFNASKKVQELISKEIARTPDRSNEMRCI